MTFTGGMEGVVVEFSTESRPIEAPPMPAGGPPPGGPGGPGMPPPGSKNSWELPGLRFGRFLTKQTQKSPKFP